MKINSQEILLLNKNMKFGEVPTETIPNPAESVMEEPETTADAGMNVLKAQAQNNVAFQGVTMPATLRKGLSKMMLVLALGGGMASTATLTSCEISSEQSMDFDMKAITEMYTQMLNLYQQMLDQQNISIQTQQEMLSYLKLIYSQAQDGNKTLKEFQQAVYEYMINSTATQQLILDQLVQNGKSQEEANQWLQQLIADVRSGKVSYEKAVAQLMEILGSIDGTLKSILEQVIGIRDDMNANHEEYMAKKDEELGYLDNIYQQGKINEQWLKFMSNGMVVMNENLVKINNNTVELLAIAQDDTKFNELMNKLDELKPTDIDYQKFEEMFKLMNMNLQDAINQFREDNKAGQNALIGAINDFKKTYITTEQKQSQQLSTIISQLNFIATYLPNLDQSGVEEAIKELTEALNKNTGAVEDNTEVIGEGLDNITSQLDAILAKLDKVIDNLSGLSTYFAEQQENWNAALGSLGDINTLIKKVIKEQKVTNSILASFKGDFNEIKNNQKTANSYLNILISKQTALENAINNIKIDGGMTREEFLSAMEERDAKAAEEFRAFIKEYGFDKVSGDVQTIKELLAEIKNAVNNQKDYSSQLDRIINLENAIYDFLKNADFSNPDYTDKLEKILKAIENWKCNCECGANSGETDESIKDLEDMFS